MKMSFNSPVSGRKSYRKELGATSSTKQHEQSPEPAEISSDESENEELDPASQEQNEIDNENDDSLEEGEIVDETFASSSYGPYTPESANFHHGDHSSESSHKRREPSAPPYAPSPRRSPSALNTNISRRNQGGPHQDCVGGSPYASSKWLFSISVCICILTIFMVNFVKSSDNATNVNMKTPPATTRCEALEKLNKTLPKHIFRVVNISVTGTLFRDSSEPCILMFLQEDLENFNKTVDEIANTVINCFDSDVKKETLDANYFKSISDPGNAVELVKAELSEGGVLVVPNLQEIRGHVARAFQSICEKNPALVKKLIVLFTLTPLKEESKNVKKPTKIAQDTLESVWKDLEYFERDPLIARVTDHVEWLRPT